MPRLILNRRHVLAAAPAALLGACAADPSSPPATAGSAPAPQQPTPPAPEDAAAGAPPRTRPEGRVEIHKTQAGFLGNVAWGRGTLIYEGRTYPFRIRGLGVGGVGVARITAVGDVYNLSRLADFPGLYGQFRTGFVVGNAVQMRGGIWLQNPSGVRLNLRPRRAGLALQVGADGILIEMRG